MRLDSAELLNWVQEQSEEKSPNLTKFTLGPQWAAVKTYLHIKILKITIVYYKIMLNVPFVDQTASTVENS